MDAYTPEGWRLESKENRAALESPKSLLKAQRQGKILEAKALVCDKAHNLWVNLGCMQGMIPREEGALGIREGTVRDIALLARVNRPVCFIVQEIRESPGEKPLAMLSRREAQARCRREKLDRVVPGDVLDARITHLEAFGAFADIGCGIVALMPIDMISVSRIHHPRDRFRVGMDIRAVVRSTENGRITLSQRELLGTWLENASRFSSGETVAGIVRSVEPYGTFVELAPNLAGLAEKREGVTPGQQASVYIKSILPERMKIKLVLIETFPTSETPAPPQYYFTGSHMDRFLYSPPGCVKHVETIFTPTQPTDP